MRKIVIVLFAVLLAVPAIARELYWESINVEAKLDADGRLHVVERQEMVFTGDWNGGERRFNTRFGQHLDFETMYRVDRSGQKIPMRAGSTDNVDGYDFVEANVLRWRSRQPSDEEFNRTPIVYELHYTLDKILLPQGGASYVLDHDFAFPDREGPIINFRLDLEIDPAWKTEWSFQRVQSAQYMEPGRGYVVTVPLTYAGAGLPNGVRFGAPRTFRLGAVAALLIGLLVIAISFAVLEAGKGRFARVNETVDTAWLEKNVFFAEPELIGALWDRATGASEVAAILAKLTQEKKITTQVSEGGWFRAPSMEMTLHAERSELRPHERALIDALFIDGSHTSLDKIRAHYKSSGFNPVSTISGPLEEFIEKYPQWRSMKRWPAWLPALVVMLLACAMLIVPAFTGGYDLSGALILGFSGIFVAVFGSILAHTFRFALSGIAGRMLAYSIPTLIQSGIAAFFLLKDEYRVAEFSAVAFVAVILAIYAFVTTFARIPPTADRLVSRHRLAHAREYFRRQLRSENPQLRDEWMPYLIAFGLGPQVDSWVKRFGVAAASSGIGHSSMRSSDSFGSSSTVSSGSSGYGFSGGGGAFGGAGATGSWAVAAGAIASGVAAPSSSGSSGGGGGGGSSGGGGGGGW